MELITKTFKELTVEELYEMLKVRESVFVVEQSCAYQEIDGADPGALHLFLKGDDGIIKAYLRVMELDENTARIGRVLTTERGRGHGLTILRAGIAACRDRMEKKSVYIEAQSYAQGYYEKEGFYPISDEFLEDGIPHIKMMLDF